MPLSASAFDALGPAHQNAKHGHDKQEQDYHKNIYRHVHGLHLPLAVAHQDAR